MPAKEDTLSQIHELLAQDMKSFLEKVKTEKRNLSPQEWTAIAKFLKDNGIESLPETNKAIRSIAEKLPFDDDDNNVIPMHG